MTKIEIEFDKESTFSCGYKKNYFQKVPKLWISINLYFKPQNIITSQSITKNSFIKVKPTKREGQN